MGLEHIAAKISADAHRHVTEETFGHLAAERDRSYQGEILFAKSQYGDYVILRATFNGLEDSPWLFDAMQEFGWVHAQEDGAIYRFRGSVKNYEFKGEVKRVSIR